MVPRLGSDTSTKGLVSIEFESTAPNLLGPRGQGVTRLETRPDETKRSTAFWRNRNKQQHTGSWVFDGVVCFSPHFGSFFAHSCFSISRLVGFKWLSSDGQSCLHIDQTMFSVFALGGSISVLTSVTERSQQRGKITWTRTIKDQ